MRHPPAPAARGRPRAHRAAGRGAGRGDREGQGRGSTPALRRGHEPVGDQGAVPGRRLVADLRSGRGRDRLLHADAQAGDPAQADPAAVPQPRQPRGRARRAQPLAGGEGRGGRRVPADRDHRAQAAGGPAKRRRGLWPRQEHGARRAHRRQGTRQGGRREVELRAGLGRRRPRHRARRGVLGTPHGRRPQGARPRRQRPPGMGARREGDLGGRGAVPQGRAHARLATAAAGQVQGVRRLLDLRHEPRGGEAQGLDRLRDRARPHRRAALRPRRAAGVQAAPAGAQDPQGRQAGRLGREGDPRGRLLGDAQAPRSRPRGLRRLRRDGQRAAPQGHPLRDPLRDARRRDDLPPAQGRLERLLVLRARPSTTRRSARTCGSRAT